MYVRPARSRVWGESVALDDHRGENREGRRAGYEEDSAEFGRGRAQVDNWSRSTKEKKLAETSEQTAAIPSAFLARSARRRQHAA